MDFEVFVSGIVLKTQNSLLLESSTSHVGNINRDPCLCELPFAFKRENDRPSLNKNLPLLRTPEWHIQTGFPSFMWHSQIQRRRCASQRLHQRSTS